MRQMKWSRGISVVEIHGASLWCEGPSNEMRSRGFTGVWWGGLTCFHFRLTDFGFFFPSVHGLRMFCYKDVVLCFLFAVRFLEQKSFWNVFFKVKLVTVLDIFQRNVFVFPSFFSSYGYLFDLIWILYCDCFDSLSVSLFSWILSVRDMFLHATLLSCGYCVLTFDPSSWMCKLNFLYCNVWSYLDVDMVIDNAFCKWRNSLCTSQFCLDLKFSFLCRNFDQISYWTLEPSFAIMWNLSYRNLWHHPYLLQVETLCGNYCDHCS